MHSWITFINLSAFILGVIVSRSDGAYDPALKQAAVDRLSRRCEECGHYDCDSSYCDCGCTSGGGYTRSKSSKSYDYVDDECCDYSGSGGGGYVKVRSAPPKKKKYSSDDDCYEYSGESSHGGKGSGRVAYSGEHEYQKSRSGGYYEEESGKGSYRGGGEYKSKSGPKSSPKKSSVKKSKGYSDC